MRKSASCLRVRRFPVSESVGGVRGRSASFGAIRGTRKAPRKASNGGAVSASPARSVVSIAGRPYFFHFPGNGSSGGHLLANRAPRFSPRVSMSMSRRTRASGAFPERCDCTKPDIAIATSTSSLSSPAKSADAAVSDSASEDSLIVPIFSLSSA